MVDLAFGFLIVVSLAGAVMAVALKKVFHNLIGFGLAILGSAGVTVILGAEFVALMQLLIFLGGIAIAMVFAVMMSTPREQDEEDRSPGRVLGAVGIGSGFMVVVGFLMLSGVFPAAGPQDDALFSAQHLGLLLLSDYALPFEAISLLLLAAILGSVIVARRSREDDDLPTEGVEGV
ncbi:MAG TPA: NADH-quinone oxidoreductase subunit J [Deltaproteobacteria bacterium]|nr:NADH-quinone oxidoreductase subunit J [Deltaproteobacteria bacterium]HCP45577.1 NADH-quinone oxidoreductase subunit J [Deltaproteobacteria bacterium]